MKKSASVASEVDRSPPDNKKKKSINEEKGGKKKKTVESDEIKEEKVEVPVVKVESKKSE